MRFVSKPSSTRPPISGCSAVSSTSPSSSAKANAANRRLLEVQRAGQGCAIESALFERISQPSLKEGQRTGALRFGEPRAMALAGALCVALNTVVGFTNRSLRAQVSRLLGGPYGSAQMTYDLRRLRLKGLVVRVPHTNSYTLTPDGPNAAIFYTKCYGRLLRPLLAADRPPATLELRQALRTIDHAVEDYAGAGTPPARRVKLPSKFNDRQNKSSYADPETRFARSGSGAPSGQLGHDQ